MINRPTAKELFAESLKELSALKPVDKITVRDISGGRLLGRVPGKSNGMGWRGDTADNRIHDNSPEDDSPVQRGRLND